MTPSLLSTLRPKKAGTVTQRHRHPTRKIYTEIHRPTREGVWPILTVVWSNKMGVHTHLLQAKTKAKAEHIAKHIAGQDDPS